MEHLFGQEWEIVPAGGATGEAFIAQHDDQRLFLKRNSSPFLAVLSAEGIVPKLIWTKRLENGDVITAQQWLEGRELSAQDMQSDRVAKLLKKIHESVALLGMLKRMGKSPLEPEHLLDILLTDLDGNVRAMQVVRDALAFLEEEINNILFDDKVVCHCDLNHNNWLLTENNQLYLIDWDGAMIADPAIDLGMMLYWYLPREQWSEWASKYGVDLNEHLLLRMKWYTIAQTLTSIQWHKDKERYEEMNRWMEYLTEIL